MQETSHSSDSDSDSDYELEEEAVVHVEVAGVLQDDLSRHSASSFKFVEIASSQPVVQIGNQVFVGEYRDTVGTSSFFTAAPPPPGTDPVFGQRPGLSVAFHEKTNKKLVLKRVFLKPKESVVSGMVGVEDKLVTTDKSEDKK